MTTETTTNLLRAVGEALAPFLPEGGGSVDTEAIVEEVRAALDGVIEDRVSDAIDGVDFDDKIDVNEKIEEYMSYSFDASDHDIMTEGNFDPSYHDLLNSSEVSELVDEKIAEGLTQGLPAEIVTIDNILSVLADALGGLPAVEQAA